MFLVFINTVNGCGVYRGERDDDKRRSKIVRDDVVSSGIEGQNIINIRYIVLSWVADD